MIKALYSIKRWLILIILSTIPLFGSKDVIAQALDFGWATSMNSFEQVEAYAVEADLWGNVYATGSFHGTIDFDPGAAIFNLTATGESDCYIVKLDALGNFIWARMVGGLGHDRSNDIAINALGEVHITGSFQNTMDFDPGPGTYNIIAEGQRDIFTLKLDSDGVFMWAAPFTGGGFDTGYGIAVDALNKVYITGWFSDTIDFDPGAAIYDLIAPGWDEMFVCKLNSNGDFMWARGTEGSQYTEGYAIVIDDFGHIYSTGLFSQTVDFDANSTGFNMTSAGSYDIFINKLDTAGNFIWIQPMGGTGYDSGYGITTDNEGNVYTTGHFEDLVDFDPGTGTYNLTSAGGYDIYMNKLDSMGNFVWAKSMGSTGYDYAFSIDLDYYSNPLITGYYSGIVDFDPSTNSSTLNSNTDGSIFINKLDSSGNYLWSGAMGTFNTQSRDISIDQNDNVYVTGSYIGSGDFDPSNNSFILSSDSLGGYIIKFNGQFSTIESQKDIINNQIAIYPNPVQDEIQIRHNLTGEVFVRIYALNGTLIFEGFFTGNVITINCTKWPEGLYNVYLKGNENKTLMHKVVKTNH